MSKKNKPPKRNMHSFEADDDVERMLERVERRGVKFVWFCNKALRKLLIEEGYGGKKDLAA